MTALARILGPWLGMNLKSISIVAPYWAGAGIMAASVLLTLGLRRPTDAGDLTGVSPGTDDFER